MKREFSMRVSQIDVPLTSHSTVVHGLMADSSGSLVPARRAAMYNAAAMRPLTQFVHAAPDSVTTLYVAYDEELHKSKLWVERADVWTVVATLQGEVYTALSVAEGIIVACSEGMYRLEPDNSESGWTLTDMNPSPPAVWFSAVDAAHLSESTGAVTLRGVTSSGTSHTIPTAELQRLTDVLTDAYARLIHTASAAGAWVQPVVVRYRLYASGRRLLYVSAPLLLAPYPMQCFQSMEAAVSIDGSNYAVSPLTLSARSWRIVMHLPDDDNFSHWLRLTDSIEVAVTPQFHPVDFDGLCSCRFARTATTSPVAIVRMPGAEFTADRHALLLASQLSVTDATSSVVLRLQSPQAGESLTLGCVAAEEVAEVVKLRQKAVAQIDTEADSDLLSRLSPPNAFLARTVAADGDMVVWGDVTPVVRSGFSLREMMAEVSQQPWLGTLKVTLADGSVITRALGGVTDMPLSFGPVVSYPHERAVRLDVYVKALDSEVLSHVGFDLKAVVGAGFSAYVSSDFEAVATEVYEGELPEVQTATSLPLSGTLVSASLSAPLLPLSLLRCSTAAVMALMPAAGSRSSFSSARGRIYALCADGIYTVTADSRGRLMSASAIDNRRIASPGAVVATPGGVMALLCGSLCRLKGAVVTTLRPMADGVELGWEPQADELWVLDNRGIVSAMPLADLSRVHTVESPEPPVHIYSLPHRLLLEAERGLMTTAAPPQLSNFVRWQGQVLIMRRTRCRALEIGMAASHFSGRIVLATHNGAGARSAPAVLSLGVSGAVNAPVRAAFLAPPARYLTLTIEGTTTADFTLTHLSLHCSP